MARKSTSPKTSSSKTSSRSKSNSSSPKRAAGSKKTRTGLRTTQKVLLVGIGTIFTAAILALSLFAPNQGQLTAWLAQMLGQAFGWGAYLVPLIAGAIGLYLVLWGMEQPPRLPVYRLLGVVILLVVVESFASMIALTRQEGLTDYWQVAQAELGGGYLGGLVATLLTGLVGDIGAIFVLIVLGFVGAFLISGITREDMSRYLRSAFSDGETQVTGDTAPRPAIRVNPGRTQTPQAVQLRLVPDDREQTGSTTPAKQEPKKESGRIRLRTKKQQKPEPPTGEPLRDPLPAGQGPAVAGVTADTEGYTWTLPLVSDILDSGSDLDVNNAVIREQVEIIEHTLESFGAPATVVEINQGPTVTQFGVEPNYVQLRNGRRTKVKVGKIASLADDLALALAAKSIRIQAPVPGKSYVGIEVPNPSKTLVSLRDVMESPAYGKIKGSLGLGLGQNVSGEAIVGDLAIMPHLLIAGTTGSGKSVCVNSIIACLLLRNTPEDLKLVMIDPKRVELTGYNGIPHLAAPVVVEMDRVISTLQWALREMDRRYETFATNGARHIDEYNKKIGRRRDAQKLPYIVVIIDELADLMMLAPEDTERAVTRLAQMARATGIHMVIATQRPSVDVVTGLIKANFPARIAFAVASGTDSRVILDSTGAERLLGQGDMLFQKPDAPAPLRLQGCFVSDAELGKLIGYWQTARRQRQITVAEAQPKTATARPGAEPAPARSAAAQAPQAAEANNGAASREPVPAPAPKETGKPPVRPASRVQPTPPEEMQSESAALEPPPQQPLWEALQEEAQKPEYSDELMPEAVALVRKLNKASTSLLQRRFRIGYTRAARLIDAMEEMGIIGPPTGTSKAREVLPAAEGDALPDVDLEKDADEA